MRPDAFVKTKRHRVTRRLRKVKIPMVLVVGGVSAMSGRRVLPTVSACQGMYSFTRVVPYSTLHKRGARSVVNYVLGCLPCNPVFCSRSAIASRPRHRVITRVVHRGTLRTLSTRVPRKVTITVSQVGAHPKGGPVISVSTAVVYRERSRGKVVVNGRNTVLGGVKDGTECRVRHVLRSGIGLGL